MLLRYLLLTALAAGSVWALFNVGADQAQYFLVDAGQPHMDERTASLWLLCVIAALITFSLCRFLIFGLPSIVDTWYEGSKHWIYTFMIGAAILGGLHAMEPTDGPGTAVAGDPGGLAPPAEPDDGPGSAVAGDPDGLAPPAEPDDAAPAATEPSDPLAPLIEPDDDEVRGSLTAP